MMSWGTNDAVLKSTEADGEDKSIKTDPEGSVFFVVHFCAGREGCKPHVAAGRAYKISRDRI